jgi:hypothetical protein
MTWADRKLKSEDYEKIVRTEDFLSSDLHKTEIMEEVGGGRWGGEHEKN